MNNNTLVSKRIIAFIIDLILIYALKSIIYFLISGYVKSFDDGRFTFFVIAILYFGLQNSKLLNGQTLGNKFQNIHVVKLDNTYLSINLSIIRSILLMTPYLISKISILDKNYSTLPFLMVRNMPFFIGATLYISMFILFYKNKSHQSLHDIITKTRIVINIEDTTIEPINNYNPVKVVSIILIIVMILGFISLKAVNEIGTNLKIVRDELLQLDNRNIKDINIVKSFTDPAEYEIHITVKNKTQLNTIVEKIVKHLEINEDFPSNSIIKLYYKYYKINSEENLLGQKTLQEWLNDSN